MDVSINEHITLLFYSVAVGAFLALIYDAVRLCRTFFGCGIRYEESPFIARLTPPLIGRRRERKSHAAARAAEFVTVFVFDIAYMLFAAAVTVIFIYHQSSGTPRGFALLGAVVGFVIYMKTAARLTAAIASYIFFAFDCILRYIVYFTVTPLRFILRTVKKLAARIYRATIGRAISAAIIALSHRREQKYIKIRLKNILGELTAVIVGEITERQDV